MPQPRTLLAALFAALLAAIPAAGLAQEMNLGLIELKHGEFRHDGELYLRVDVVNPAETYGVLQTLYMEIGMRDDPSLGKIALRLRDLGLVNGQTHQINVSIPPAEDEDNALHQMLSEAAKEGRYYPQTELTFIPEEGTPAKAPRALVSP